MEALVRGQHPGGGPEQEATSGQPQQHVCRSVPHHPLHCTAQADQHWSLHKQPDQGRKRLTVVHPRAANALSTASTVYWAAGPVIQCEALRSSMGHASHKPTAHLCCCAVEVAVPVQERKSAVPRSAPLAERHAQHVLAVAHCLAHGLPRRSGEAAHAARVQPVDDRQSVAAQAAIGGSQRLGAQTCTSKKQTVSQVMPPRQKVRGV